MDNNRRNGSYKKTIIEENGNQLTVEVPRDREGEFTPQLLPKGIRRFVSVRGRRTSKEWNKE